MVSPHGGVRDKPKESLHRRLIKSELLACYHDTCNTVACLYSRYSSHYFPVGLNNLHQVRMQKKWTLWSLTQDTAKREEKHMRMAAMMKQGTGLVFSVHISEKKHF